MIIIVRSFSETNDYKLIAISISNFIMAAARVATVQTVHAVTECFSMAAVRREAAIAIKAFHQRFHFTAACGKSRWNESVMVTIHRSYN